MRLLLESKASVICGLLTAFVVALCIGATSAQADTLELELTSGGSSSGVIFGTPCGGGTEICVSFSGTVGAWDINMTSGDSLNAGDAATMDLSSLNATASGTADPLEIELSGTDFTSSDPAWDLQASGNLVSGTGTVTYSAYFDNTNTAPSEANLIGTLGPFSSSYLASQSFTNNASSPYSLTEVVSITAGTGGAKWSTDSSIAAPEPSGLLLTGLGIGALLFTKRRLVLA